MVETVSRRLHISGLTPSLTASDICLRFSAFGKITDVTGFGSLDANGNPRKFAYLTFEATEDKLRRCLSSLSGTVWKGAKLRIGDARPDYKERIRKELNEMENKDCTRPRKRPRLSHVGTNMHSKSMELVTTLAASQRGAWKMDPVTRTLLRPMKMKPSRPIHVDLVPDSVKSKRMKRHGASQRVRIVKIDPSLWGNLHLRETDFGNPTVHPAITVAEKTNEFSDLPKEKRQRKDTSAETSASMRGGTPLHSNVSEHMTSSRSTRKFGQTDSTQTATSGALDIDISVTEETSRALDLLRTMFGDAEEWGGQEAIESTDEEALSSQYTPSKTIADKDLAALVSKPKEIVPCSSEDDESVTEPPAHHNVDETRAKKASLKDMFKPQEAEGFSLINDLDLDLDLDPTIADFFSGAKPVVPVETSVQRASPAPGVDSTIQRQTVANKCESITINPSLPFFFTCPNNHAKNAADVIEARLRKKFCRTESSEEIRKRWNERKGGLTREWKKRHREALKANRLRGMKDF